MDKITLRIDTGSFSERRWETLELSVGSDVPMWNWRSKYDHQRGCDLVVGKLTRITPSGRQFLVELDGREVRFNVTGYDKDRAEQHGLGTWESGWHITTPGELARMRAEQAEADARRALAKRVNALQAALADALKPLEQRDLEPDELVAAIRAVEGLRQGLASIRRQ